MYRVPNTVEHFEPTSSQRRNSARESCHFGNDTTAVPRNVKACAHALSRTQSPGPAKMKDNCHRLKTMRRREQCRKSQERYRKRQAQLSKELEISVSKLRDEIPLLKIELARMTLNQNCNLWSVVTHYFHLFHYGADPHVSTEPRMTSQNPEAQRQLIFLRSFMTRDVILGELHGVDALLEQWRRYSTYFDSLQLRLHRLTKPSGRFLWASSTLGVTISETTLQKAFPHLCQLKRVYKSYQEMKAS